MSTKALIDRVQPFASGWSRTGVRSLLTLAKQGRDLLFDYDSPYMHFTSTDNKGFPPYLTTVAGTYRYDLMTANLSATLAKTIGGTAYSVKCRKVVRIFVDLSLDYDYNTSLLGNPYLHGFFNPYSTTDTRVAVANIPFTQSPGLEDTDAYIDFLEDPGTSTDRYFVDFLWEPPRLTAETIPLVVPEIFEQAIEKYMIGRIQEYASGQPSNQMREFIEYWIPKFRHEALTTGTRSVETVLCQY